VTHSYPIRAKLARTIIQNFDLPRGKDRLYLTLRSILRIPQKMTVDLTPTVKLNVNLDDYLQRWIFCHRLKDEPDYFYIGKILKQGEHFLDIGANIGIVSLIASRSVGDLGKVYAVEALPTTRKLLEENIALNDARNIKVIPFALLDKTGEVKFYGSTDGNIGGSSLSAQGQKGKPVIVEGKTLDSLLTDGTIEKCDVMKMDIEGAEILALRGMKNLFANHKPRAVMIEVADEHLAQFSANPADIIEFFSNHGYFWYEALPEGFKQVQNLDLKGYNNLWAILPNGVEENFLL
jgi:FkbM family methyltransferase